MNSPTSATREDHDRVYELIMAGWGSQVIRTLAQLSVAERLQAGPLTAEDLATQLGSNHDMTDRLMRAAAAMGFLAFDARTGLFSSTAMLEILRAQSPLSLQHYAQAVGSDVFWLPSARLPDTVMRGRNCAEEVLGCTPFEYFAEHEPQARLFSAAMTELSTPVIAEATSVIDIAGAHTILDVGGASGTFLASLLQHHKQAHGSVLDLAHVIPDVAEEAQRRGVSDRMTAIAGDFFAEVPSADLCLLKFILHDWDDESCRRILSNVRRAIGSDGRVVIVEMATDTTSLVASLMDIGMMFAFTGRERDVSQFDDLLTNAGLLLQQVVRLHPPYVLIEAVAA
jgi:hypothetical protein